MDKTLTQKNLNLVRWFGEEEKMDSPLGFCLGIENQLLVTDTGNNRVVIFDITTAKVCLRFGSYGTGNGYFVKPRKASYLIILITTSQINGLNRSKLILVFSFQGYNGASTSSIGGS